MKNIFADTFYWVSLLNPKDEWYNRVNNISDTLGQFRIITIDEVLVEMLAFYSNSGFQVRQRAVN